MKRIKVIKGQGLELAFKEVQRNHRNLVKNHRKNLKYLVFFEYI